MKIRNGFVSNSSSSSFHIYGVELDIHKFEISILDKGLTTQKEIDEYGLDEVIWDIIPGLGGKCVYEWDAVYLGRYYSSIGDDETGKEFKESTEKAIKEFLGDEAQCKELEEVYPS